MVTDAWKLPFLFMYEYGLSDGLSQFSPRAHVCLVCVCVAVCDWNVFDCQSFWLARSGRAHINIKQSIRICRWILQKVNRSPRGQRPWRNDRSALVIISNASGHQCQYQTFLCPVCVSSYWVFMLWSNRESYSVSLAHWIYLFFYFTFSYVASYRYVLFIFIVWSTPAAVRIHHFHYASVLYSLFLLLCYYEVI